MTPRQSSRTPAPSFLRLHRRHSLDSSSTPGAYVPSFGCFEVVSGGHVGWSVAPSASSSFIWPLSSISGGREVSVRLCCVGIACVVCTQLVHPTAIPSNSGNVFPCHERFWHARRPEAGRDSRSDCHPASAMPSHAVESTTALVVVRHVEPRRVFTVAPQLASSHLHLRQLLHTPDVCYTFFGRLARLALIPSRIL